MNQKDKQFYILVLGCQMNQADSERIREILKQLDYRETNNEKSANLIIVVACSVRQKAIDRTYGKAKLWLRARKKGNLKTILTGCVLKRDEKNLKKYFDEIIKITEISRLPEILNQELSLSRENYLCLPVNYQSTFSAFVPISNGCNNFCSYCAVPYTRGREIHRDAKSIIDECEKLINQGYKEIILLGQNVNSYQNGKYNFPKLLKKIDKIKGDYWLRFVTSHPKDLSNELIDVMASGVHLVPHLHLALQSGDDQILEKMNRHYTADYYKKLIKQARSRVKNLAVSTDVIVGFPGESEKQFNNTLKLMKEISFDMVFINKYSSRPQTVAEKFKDDVSLTEKKKRAEKLNETLIKGMIKNDAGKINLVFKVLVDSYKKNKCYGKTEGNKIVEFNGDKNLIGKFVAIKVNKIKPFIWQGELV